MWHHIQSINFHHSIKILFVVITCSGHVYASAFHSLHFESQYFFYHLVFYFWYRNISERFPANVRANIADKYWNKRYISRQWRFQYFDWHRTKKTYSWVGIVFVAYQDLHSAPPRAAFALQADGQMSLCDAVLAAELRWPVCRGAAAWPQHSSTCWPWWRPARRWDCCLWYRLTSVKSTNSWERSVFLLQIKITLLHYSCNTASRSSYMEE